MNKTEPGNIDVFGPVGKENGVYSSIPGVFVTTFLQSQTAGLLAGRKARRNLGFNYLSAPHRPVGPEPLMASRSCSSPDFWLPFAEQTFEEVKKYFLCTEI